MHKETPYLQRQVNEKKRLNDLLNHLAQLLPDIKHRKDFFKYSQLPPPASVRLNTIVKPTNHLILNLREQCNSVPWCKDGFVLPDDSIPLGHTLEHAMGAIYIQAKAPMLAVETLAPEPGERVLDLCAAPGGKTTQIAARMHNTGLLIANDMNPKRLPSLVSNIERCGVANAIVTKTYGTNLARYFHNYFDKILVDAPCSGDGIVRKNLNLLRYWSPQDAQRQAEVQSGLLRAAFHMLRPGGTLVYSTCSLSMEENEYVVINLIKRFGDKVVIQSPSYIEDPCAETTNDAVIKTVQGIRIWPHIHDTEGAFVAKITKRCRTKWNKFIDDAELWTKVGSDNISARQAIKKLEYLWQTKFPRTPGHVFVYSGRHLVMQPAITDAIQKHLPFFVRSGIRLGRRHNDHHYLSQEAVSLWGEKIHSRYIDLNWQQVTQLFQGLTIPLRNAIQQRGEIICRFGSWSLCRAMVEADGTYLRSMLPKMYRRKDIVQMFQSET